MPCSLISTCLAQSARVLREAEWGGSRLPGASEARGRITSIQLLLVQSWKVLTAACMTVCILATQLRLTDAAPPEHGIMTPCWLKLGT